MIRLRRLKKESAMIGEENHVYDKTIKNDITFIK